MARKNDVDITFIDIAYSVSGKSVPDSILQSFKGIKKEFLTDTEKDVLSCMLSTYSDCSIFPTFDFLVKRYNIKQGDVVCKSTADIVTALRQMLEKRRVALAALELSDIQVTAGSTKEMKEGLAKIQNSLKTSSDVEIERFKSIKEIFEAELLLPRGLSFGLICVDEKTSGMQPGTVGCIGAFTSQGKSTVVNNMLYTNALAGKKCAVVSLEIPKNLCHYIYLSRHSKHMNKMPITYQALIKKDLSEVEKNYLYEEVDKDFQEKISKNLLVLDSGDVPEYSEEGFRELYNIADELLGGVDLFAWDHANQFMYVNPGSFKTGNNYIHDIAEVTKTFKNKKNSLTSTIFAMQCNRDGWRSAKKRGGVYDMTALSDFNEMERSCTYVVFIYADEVMRSANTAQIQLVKHRIGETMLAPETVDVLFPYSAIGNSFKDTISSISSDREIDILQGIMGNGFDFNSNSVTKGLNDFML